MIRDHELGPQVSRQEHVEESARLTWTDGPRTEEDIAATIRNIELTGEPIHIQVWTQAEFLALLLHCRSRFNDGFDIEITQRHLIEVIAVLRKAGAPREFAGAPPLHPRHARRIVERICAEQHDCTRGRRWFSSSTD